MSASSRSLSVFQTDRTSSPATEFLVSVLNQTLMLRHSQVDTWWHLFALDVLTCNTQCSSWCLAVDVKKSITVDCSHWLCLKAVIDWKTYLERCTSCCFGNSFPHVPCLLHHTRDCSNSDETTWEACPRARTVSSSSVTLALSWLYVSDRSRLWFERTGCTGCWIRVCAHAWPSPRTSGPLGTLCSLISFSHWAASYSSTIIVPQHQDRGWVLRCRCLTSLRDHVSVTSCIRAFWTVRYINLLGVIHFRRVRLSLSLHSDSFNPQIAACDVIATSSRTVLLRVLHRILDHASFIFMSHFDFDPCEWSILHPRHSMSQTDASPLSSHPLTSFWPIHSIQPPV